MVYRKAVPKDDEEFIEVHVFGFDQFTVFVSQKFGRVVKIRVRVGSIYNGEPTSERIIYRAP